MAINFTTDILTVNEDDALNAGTDETTQLAFDTALPAISAYLATQTAGTDGDIQTPEVASQANFVNLAFTGGSKSHRSHLRVRRERHGLLDDSGRR